MEGLALEAGVEALKYLLDSFIQQLNEQKRLIGDAPFQVEELEKDVNFLKDYVKEEAVKKSKSDNLITRTLLREVGVSIYRAEDAIDSFIIEAAEGGFSKLFAGVSKSKLVEIAQLVNSVAESVKKVREKVEQHINFSAGGLGADQNEGLGEYEGPPGKQKYAPIFIEEEEQLRQRLSREAEQPEVIFITGTHGIGKTTLAAKMLYDSDIRDKFTKHIWIGLSDPTPKNIFLAILRQLNKLPDQVRNDWELSQLVLECLKGETFLLVLDNVWEIQDWGRLKSAFEMSDRRAKVLITSNNDETARFISPDDAPIKLNQLEVEDSWSLLKFRVFSKLECPPKLEKDGLLIAANCNGLPQAIAFAGDTLAKKDSRLYEMSRRQQIWRELSLGMTTYVNDGNTSTLSSYGKLPYHLRPCFLYLGIFPKGSKFSVSKLIRMWIAEGFVRPIAGATLEGTAQDYLAYLIDKNLVIVEEARPDGSPKTCSMNALLYDFCTAEAGNERENFLQEFRKCGTDGAFDPPITEVEKNRRVSIHAHLSNFIQKFISSRHANFKIHIRSFVSHSKEVFALQSRDVSSIRAAFKLLRVLDAKPIKVDRIHKDLCLLVHLRYVTISLNGDFLPEAISKLQNMQTLIVHTTSPTLNIKSDILKMDELRHFKTNASATLLKKSKASANNENLQTLCGISPKSCTQEFFNKAPNLKKLGIHGQLAPLLDGKNELLRNLVKVEKLKLLNDATCPNYEGKLCSLPQFPPSLKRLTLSATFLDLAQISILGSLQKLEELKLNDNAFVGETWDVRYRDFPNLRTLHIEGLHFKEWRFSSGLFPQLKRLMLFDCKELREIPLQLADISTFTKLHVRNGKTSAAAFARKIFDVKRRMKMTDNSIIFDFSISPDYL